jgi:DNA ligase D-like protein (predicted 3'-phosphoesterase)
LGSLCDKAGGIMASFLVQRHAAGRRHYDLRLVQDDQIRSWSLLKEPPSRKGERRLAVERESLSAEQISRPFIEEDAFGTGRARVWDSGEAIINLESHGRLVLLLTGSKMRGRYELRRMRWYPGNRWLMEKSGSGDANST